MEINNPANNQVTNGLLVVELITGRVQQGDQTFDEMALTGAGDIAAIGDPANPYPTYRQLASVFNKPDPTNGSHTIGRPVTREWYGNFPSSAPKTGMSSTRLLRSQVLKTALAFPTLSGTL